MRHMVERDIHFFSMHLPKMKETTHQQPHLHPTESIGTIEDSGNVQDPVLTEAFASHVQGDISEDVSKIHTVVENEGQHHQKLLGGDQKLESFREGNGLHEIHGMNLHPYSLRIDRRRRRLGH